MVSLLCVTLCPRSGLRAHAGPCKRRPKAAWSIEVLFFIKQTRTVAGDASVFVRQTSRLLCKSCTLSVNAAVFLVSSDTASSLSSSSPGHRIDQHSLQPLSGRAKHPGHIHSSHSFHSIHSSPIVKQNPFPGREVSLVQYPVELYSDSARG